MGQIPPKISITTTHQASNEARSLCKVLEHVIPNSKYIARGSKNFHEICEISLRNQSEFLFVCHSKGNKVSEIRFFKVQKNNYEEINEYLKIYEYIDYKIFGWKGYPEKGPLSVSRETRNEHPVLVDFLEKIFRVVIGKKTSLWLLIDSKKTEGYIQFVDSLTIKPFTHLRIKLIYKKQDV